MPRRFAWKRFFSWPFVTAVVLLSGSLAATWAVSRGLDLVRMKAPLPLRRPLAQLDRASLGPYQFVRSEMLSPEVEEALGTREYINWELADTRREEGDPLRKVHLHVTYYTGSGDLPVHTADVCMAASGYAPIGSHETEVLSVPELGAAFAELPVRIQTFQLTGDRAPEAGFTVIHTLFCAGRFFSTAQELRWVLRDFSRRYAYFSKVQVIFPDASREDSLRGAREFYAILLPCLLKMHWPVESP